MAIKNPCSKCGQILSVPDELSGKRVNCPACGMDNRIVGPDTLKAMIREEAQAEVQRRREARNRKRLELLSRLSDDTSDDGPDAQPARRSLKRLSGYEDVLLLAAYGLPFFTAVLGALGIALVTGWQARVVVGGFFFFVAMTEYLTCKVLRELVRSTVSLGELQIETSQADRAPNDTVSAEETPEPARLDNLS